MVYLQIGAGVLIFAVPHVSGQYRQGMLGILTAGPNLSERVNGKRMSQAVRHGFAEGHITDDLPRLADADGLNGAMEDMAHLIVMQAPLLFGG